MTGELNTLELKCGITLELQAVNDMLLLDLMEGIRADTDGKYTIQGMSVKDLNRMMRYFCGWGVKNDVPADMADDVSIFGAGKHIQRAAWVRMIATTPELTQLFGQVMALTQIKAKRAQQPTPTPEQTELERLRAENAELKAQDGERKH